MERRNDGKGQTADVGIAGALLLARDAVFEVGELALDIGLHAVERGHAALQLVDAKAPQDGSAYRVRFMTLTLPRARP